MSLNELMWQFNSIRKGCENKDLFDFARKLMEQNSKEYLDFHYGIIQDTETEGSVYDFICRKFRDRGDAGEDYLIERINTEQNNEVKASVLQMLGSYRNGNHKAETAELARGFLKSISSVLRCRALWVLGWIGTPDDLEAISKALYCDTDEDNRCWAASAMMQMFFDYKEIAPIALTYLKKALETEATTKAKWGILLSVQEISGNRLGLKSNSHTLPSERTIKVAYNRAVKILENY